MRIKNCFIAIIIFSLPLLTNSSAASMDKYVIPSHGQGHAKYPIWFKQSLLDLRSDLEDARESGKRGIIIMFSQKNCAHCQAFIETTLQDNNIQQRVRDNYDVIGLDIFSDNELTYINGTVTTVKNLAEEAKARLTPTLLFIGIENKPLLKIIGLYLIEKFNHVLDYIENNHFKKISLRDYFKSTKQTFLSHSSPVKYNFKLFETPPLSLIQKIHQPTLVLFETPNCNPCNRFHKKVLPDSHVQKLMTKFRTIQIDSSDISSKISTTTGKLTTPKTWANQLQINYDIAIVFLDAQGREVHRIDSEFGKDRMIGSMQYVLENAYKKHEQFLQWRKEQAQRKKLNK